MHGISSNITLNYLKMLCNNNEQKVNSHYMLYFTVLQMHMHRSTNLNEDIGITAVKLGTVDNNGNEGSNVYLDRVDTIRYSRSGTAGGEGVYEPLCMDMAVHHSRCDHTQETEREHDGGYAPLDITKLQDAKYAVPVVGETPGEKTEYANSQGIDDPEYAVLVDTRAEKAELHESKTGPTALEQGAEIDRNSTGYANTGFASSVDSHKGATHKANWRQHFPKMTMKGKANQSSPTTAKPKKPKQHSGSIPTVAADDNIVVKSGVDGEAAPSVVIEEDQPATKEKCGKKPLLPKHVTTASATLPSSAKGKTPASTAALPSNPKGKTLASPLATKKTPAKDGGSSSTGKVSVAELARRLEKGKK